MYSQYEEYKEGQRANWSGVKHTDNPYPQCDLRGAYWLMGWIDEARAYLRVMNVALAAREVA